MPGRPGLERPGAGDRPVTLPSRPGGSQRPGQNWVNRPGVGNRPGNRWPHIGDINIGNTVINNRPSWVNIGNDRMLRISNRWGNQIGGIHNWHTRYPQRVAVWGRWGNGVRRHWGHYHHHHHWFRPNWWWNYRPRLSGWHYGYGWAARPWHYWWSVPTFTTCVNWFNWTAPPTVWTQPVYYDYGQGGNIVYENNQVYVNGQSVATAEEFAQSAAALATVPAPESEEQAEQAEWLPLGTFAVATDEKDLDPSRVVQIAVSKEGIVSGTLYNTQTDEVHAVQGQVDKATQRVAFRVGESDEIVGETGLFNLTQNEAPVLLHFGPDKVETYLLVRLEAPETDESLER